MICFSSSGISSSGSSTVSISPFLLRVNVVTRSRNGEMLTVLEPLEEMPDELKQIIEDKA